MQIQKHDTIQSAKIQTHHSNKQHKFTAKKVTAIINSKKLPMDFFADKNKQKYALTTQRKRKTHECSPEHYQIISQRKIISQNMINLNQNFDTHEEAQITSFFGFKPQNQHSFGVKPKERTSQNCDHSFENIRINQQYIQQKLKTQKNQSTIKSYLQNNLSFGLLQVQPKCSVQLNSPEDQKKHLSRQQLYRKAILDCTFAMKPTNTIDTIKKNFKLVDSHKKMKGKSLHLVRRSPDTNNKQNTINKKQHKTITQASKQNQLKQTTTKKSYSKKGKNNLFEKNTTERLKYVSQNEHEQNNRRIRLPPISNKESLFH